MEQIKVSVVIPVYNVAPYLHKCVASVQEQTLQEIEIILVDDGSTDESGTICDQLAGQDKRIRVIHKSNGGLSDARNVGMSHAQGRYIAFLDSDDYWERPPALQEMLQLVENEPCPVDCVLFSYVKQPMDGGPATLVTVEKPDKMLNINQQKMALLGKRQFANSACSKLYRTKFLRDNSLGFPLGMRSEDLPFSENVLRAMHGFLVYTPVVLVYQTGRKSSISTAFTSINYEHIRRQAMQAIADAQGYSEQDKELALAYWAEQMCWFFAFLPQSGKSLKNTVRECEPLFEVMRWGVCHRAKIVRLMLRLLGKMNTIRLLSAYLKLKR